MRKIVLFDMDGTLTPPRKELDRDLIPALRELAKISEIGIVTGSDHNYVLQQMGLLMENSEIRYKLHILPCNGTKYYPPPQDASHKHELIFEKNMREELEDVVYMKALEAGDSSAQSASVTKKNALRDAPANSAIANASSISALKSAWDTSVLGDSPYA